MEYIAIFLVCSFSGVLTGLLGIGGGLIIVPAFLIMLPWFGITDFSIHQIIGISSTCVFFNSASGLFYRRSEEFLPRKFIIGICGFVVTGTLLGAYFSSFAPKNLLLSIFVFITLISIFLITKDVHLDLKKNHLKPFLYLSFALIGAVSASIGIGGAVLFATVLKCFTGQTPKKLLPTITLIVAVHALFAFLGKFFAGDILPVIIPVSIVSSLAGANIGVKISKRLSAKNITDLMVMFLILSLLRIIFEFF